MFFMVNFLYYFFNDLVGMLLVLFLNVRLENVADWPTFFKSTSTEAIQWHQYNTFSRALTVRLALRYKDKQVSGYHRTYL